MRVLLVQTSFLGDTILSTPLIGALKGLHPECELFTLTTRLSAELLQFDRRIAKCIIYDKSAQESSVFALLRKAAELRGHGFDKAYVLHRSARTALLLSLSGIKWRRGFKEASLSWLYSDTVKRRREPHEVLRNLSLLAPEGYCEEEFGELSLALQDWSTLSLQDRELLNSVGENALVLAPGSAWRTKQWHVEGYHDLAVHFAGQGRKVVIVGAPSERVVCEAAQLGSSGSAQNQVEPNILNFAGKLSLALTMQLVSRAALIVCNDSMIAHMASAFKRPVVSIFCSTSPEFGFTPWKTEFTVLEVSGLSCKPCGRHGRHFCPVGTQACMKGLSAAQVITACEQYLA